MAGSGSLPFGGIFSSACECETAWISRLSSGLPGTPPGPLSPPLSTASRLSSRKPDDCFFGPWHLTHCSSRIGRTRDSKNSIASGGNDRSAGRRGTPSPAAKAPAGTCTKIANPRAANDISRSAFDATERRDHSDSDRRANKPWAREPMGHRAEGWTRARASKQAGFEILGRMAGILRGNGADYC